LSIAAVAGICELGPYLYGARCRLINGVVTAV